MRFGIDRQLDRLRAFIQQHISSRVLSPSQRVFTLTLVIGLVCGIVAVGFHLAIRLAEHVFIDSAMGAPGSSWMIWTVLTPTIGGLLAGVFLTYLVPGARGSGVPQVKQSYAVGDSRIRFRDALGKFLLGTLQIGTGASLGREGPTVQICAGVASGIARIMALPPKQLKRLMPVGVAAGIAAAFNAPIAAVTFTIEEIVGHLDQTVLSGVVVAAALAAVVERSVLGVHPVIESVQSFSLEHASSLPFYALLGVAAAFVSMLFTDGLLALRLYFKSFKHEKYLPIWSRPAIGGLVTGLLAVGMLRFLNTGGITGGGYDTLRHALAGELPLRVLAALCIGKLVATVFSYSSGGAGGIFAPSLFIGSMLGGVVGHADMALLDHSRNELGAFALVGMGAVFAGVIRAPITSVLIIFEMTGSYGLVLPLMIANMSAYGIARHFRPTPIYEALLKQDGVYLPSHGAKPHPLEHLRVESTMSRTPTTLAVSRTVAQAVADLQSKMFSMVPVLDENGRLLGLASVAALRKAAAEGHGDAHLYEFIGPAETIESNAPLMHAAVCMNRAGVRQLVVLDPKNESQIMGIVAMSDIVRTYARVASRDVPAGETPWQTAVPGNTTYAEVHPSNPSLPDQASLLQARVRHLLMRTEPLLPSTRLDPLVDRLIAARDGVLPIRLHSSGSYGLVYLDLVRDIFRDEHLENVLVALDLARSAPSVDIEATLSDALKLMNGEGLDALPVVDGPSGADPCGVITRAEIGRWLVRKLGESTAPIGETVGESAG